MFGAKPWSQEEDNVLYERYNKEGAAALLEALPGRTRSAIQQRAFKLDIAARKPHWTAKENRQIRELQGTKTNREIGELIGRSGQAVKSHILYMKKKG